MERVHPEAVSEVLRAPLLRACLPFMVGLLLARGTDVSVATAWWLSAIAVIIAGAVMLRRWSYPMRWLRGAALAFAMIALGMVWWCLRDPFRASPGIPREGDLLVEVSEVSSVSDRSTRVEAVVLASPDSAASEGSRLLLTIGRDTMLPGPTTGDRLWIHTTPRPIDRVPDPGGFDRRSYSASRGITMDAYVSADGWRVAAHMPHWTDVFATAREHIAQWLEASGLPRRERALAKALLIGVRDELEMDQKTAFARSGTMHVLAVSGMHVGLIWAVLNALLGWWGNKTAPRLARGLLILAALWAYTGLTGGSPSVLRAAVMCSLFTVGGMTARNSSHLNSLFAAGFVLLLWDPLMFWQLSFQLSFLAVLGIILFYKPLLRLWHPPNLVLHYLWSAAVVSVAAQLTTTPLSMLVFKSFPIWFLPANIVVVGVVSLAVYGSALLILFFKMPWLGPALTWCMTQLLLFLGWSTAVFAGLPGAYPGVRIDALQCLLLYVLIGAFAAWIAWGGRMTRWVAALALLLGLIRWGVDAHTLNHMVRFTVHDRYDGLMTSLQCGRDLFVMADDSVLDHPRTRAALEAQQRATGAEWAGSYRRTALDRQWIRTGPAALVKDLWNMPGCRVAFLGPEGEAVPPLPLDVVVLTDGNFDPQDLIALGPPRQVVLSPVIDGLDRYQIRMWCEENRVSCHDVKRQGAFIFEIER